MSFGLEPKRGVSGLKTYPPFRALWRKLTAKLHEVESKTRARQRAARGTRARGASRRGTRRRALRTRAAQRRRWSQNEHASTGRECDSAPEGSARNELNRRTPRHVNWRSGSALELRLRQAAKETLVFTQRAAWHVGRVHWNFAAREGGIMHAVQHQTGCALARSLLHNRVRESVRAGSPHARDDIIAGSDLRRPRRGDSRSAFPKIFVPNGSRLHSGL